MAKNLPVLLIILLTGSLLSGQQLSPDLQTLLPTLNSADSLKHSGMRATRARITDASWRPPASSWIPPASNAWQAISASCSIPGEPEPTTVQFLRDTIDFGTINEGFILLDSFVVVNTGSHPYVISGSKGSCDCTALGLPKYPVMPGDSAVIRVEFDSYRKAGKTLAGVIIYDNSKAQQKAYSVHRRECKAPRKCENDYQKLVFTNLLRKAPLLCLLFPKGTSLPEVPQR
jgi:hypothetical protein